MENKNSEFRERFHYSMPMQMADWAFNGSRKSPHSMAGAFSDPKYVKKRSLCFLRRIRNRVTEIITHDEMLKHQILGLLNTLEEEFKTLSPHKLNQIDIIGYLFSLVAYLLGWGTLDGSCCRTPVYFQTLKQQEEAFREMQVTKSPFEIAYEKTRIIAQYLAAGFSFKKIALLLNMPESSVVSLNSAQYIDEQYRVDRKKE